MIFSGLAQKSNENNHRPTINRYMQCRKRRVSSRNLEKKKLQVVLTERGSFTPLPAEVWVFISYAKFLFSMKSL